MSDYVNLLKHERMEIGYKLKDAEKKNAKYNLLANKLRDYAELSEQLSAFINLNKTVLSLAQKEYREYKEHRLDEISKYIEGSIAVLFPEREYKVRLVYSDSRSQKDVTLSFIGKNGEIRFPFVTEGNLNNQVIAYSAAFGLVRAFDYNKIYIDEAFSAAHPSNLKKTAKQIEDAVDGGMQIFLIQQAKEGYESLARREFHLEHHMTSIDGYEETVLKSVTDFEKEAGLYGADEI